MKNKFYATAITLVAALGGLLFGYDTAVISGTTGALDNFFIRPLMSDPIAAASVIAEYRVIVSISFLFVSILLSSFMLKLFGRTKGAMISVGLVLVGALLWYTQFWDQSTEINEAMASAIKGFVISSALVGCIIGGSLGGYVSTSLGRRFGLLLSAILFTLSAIGSALPDYLNILPIETVSSLIFYRIIGGVGVGLASMLSPMYIAEISPADQRGKLVTYQQYAIIGGMVVVYFVNYFISLQGSETWLNEIGWRWMFASEIIPCIVFFTLLLFVPETPRYLVMVDQEQKANALLVKLVGEQRAKIEMTEIKGSLVEKHAPWLSFGGWVIVAGILISFFQQAVGINVVLYYAPEIFRTMGSSNDSSLMQTIIVGVVNLTFITLPFMLSDKYGRKPFMIIGALGMAVSMVGLGCTFYFKSVGLLSLIFMLTYTASFAISWGPVAWILLSEMFPNSIRGAMAIAVAAQWLSNLVVSWTFPMLNDSAYLTANYNHAFAYWVYAIFGVLAALFVWKGLPETKGKTLEEIERVWKK